MPYNTDDGDDDDGDYDETTMLNFSSEQRFREYSADDLEYPLEVVVFLYRLESKKFISTCAYVGAFVRFISYTVRHCFANHGATMRVVN